MAVQFEEIENDLRVYDLGRKLQRMSPDLWEIILDTFASIRDTAQDDVFALPPGDPTVPTAHAAASALTQAYRSFKKGIEDAIEFAAKPSEELRAYLKQAVEAADVVRQMEKR